MTVPNTNVRIEGVEAPFPETILLKRFFLKRLSPNAGSIGLLVTPRPSKERESKVLKRLFPKRFY
jgi:hypothetical protein